MVVMENVKKKAGCTPALRNVAAARPRW